jgi:hypothetical protein
MFIFIDFFLWWTSKTILSMGSTTVILNAGRYSYFKLYHMITDEKIYNQAISDGMPPVLATLIVAQARHETGGYTSNVFKTCNNCFGYKWVGQSSAAGPCTSSPEGNEYAKYNTIEQSTHELTQWIRRRQTEGKFPADLHTINTPDQYGDLLKTAGYFGDSLTAYVNGLIYWLQKIGSTITSPASVTAILILIALGMAIFRKQIFR